MLPTVVVAAATSTVETVAAKERPVSRYFIPLFLGTLLLYHGVALLWGYSGEIVLRLAFCHTCDTLATKKKSVSRDTLLLLGILSARGHF